MGDARGIVFSKCWALSFVRSLIHPSIHEAFSSHMGGWLPWDPLQPRPRPLPHPLPQLALQVRLLRGGCCVVSSLWLGKSLWFPRNPTAASLRSFPSQTCLHPGSRWEPGPLPQREVHEKGPWGQGGRGGNCGNIWKFLILEIVKQIPLALLLSLQTTRRRGPTGRLGQPRVPVHSEASLVMEGPAVDVGTACRARGIWALILVLCTGCDPRPVCPSPGLSFPICVWGIWWEGLL